MSQQDIIVIGSGHNGLICAAYLAKAGYKVTVLERRDTIGGAVCTETMFKSDENPSGFRMDVGSSVHIMIHQTGILEELELHNYGLEYIEMDPFMSYPLPKGKGVIHFFKDIERTIESIAKVAPEDVQNYRDFVSFWGKLNKGVLKAFLTTPKGGSLMAEIIKANIREKGLFKGDQMVALQKVLAPYGQVIEEAFENEYLKTAIMWFAAQSGPTPDHPASGDFAGWHAMLHESGAKHPRGGSGMLTQALKNYIEAHNGHVISESPVNKILIQNSKAVGVQTENGEILMAKAVISNAHVQTTMLKMVGPEYLGSTLTKRVQKINIGNGFGMVFRAAVKELPNYSAALDDPYIHHGMQLLCPSRDYMFKAIGDYHKKLPPEDPAVLGMTFSAIDPEVAPDGNHTLFAWAQWHPYELANGLKWDDIREQEAQKIYDVVCKYAPNMKDQLIDWYIQSPLDIERKHGLLKGNVMHVEMTFDQMFMFRPIPELSTYETPIKNLYLASASCHPGGGVFGAAGYNAAKVVLKKGVK